MHASSLQLRLLSVAALLTALGACTEPEDTPDGPSASITVVVDARETNVLRDALIGVTSRNAAGALSTETMVGTVATAAAAIGNLRAAGEDANVGAATASAVPGEDGASRFAFRCLAVGEARITFSDSNGSRDAVVECIAAPRNVTVNTAQCANVLQADGFSSCPVTVSIPNATADSKYAVAVKATDASGADVDVSGLGLLSADGGNETAPSLAERPLANGQGTFFVHSPARNTVLNLVLTVTDELKSTGTGNVSIAPFADQSSLTISAATRIAAGATTNVTLNGRTFNGSAAGEATVEVAIVGASTTDGGCLTGTTATLDAQGNCTFAITADAGRSTPIVIDGLLALPDGTTKAATTRSIAIALVGEVTIDRAPAGLISIRPEGAAAVPGTNFPTSQEVTLKLKKATVGGDENLTQATVVIAVATASRSLITIGGFAPAAGAGATNVAATITNPANGDVAFTIAAASELALGTAQVTVTVTDANPVTGVAPVTEHVVDVALVRQRALSQILFVGANPARLGVRGGSLPSSSTVSFRVTDEAGAGVANEAVTFQLLSSGSDAIVDASASTGPDGTVNVQVQAGRNATPITVRAAVASRAESGVPLVATSPAIPVVSGLPSSDTNALQCVTKAAFDPFTTECIAVLSDQFTNRVTTSNPVQFRAESGNITSDVDSGTSGEAAATFVFSEPGPGSADVRQWSHSRVPPPSSLNTSGAIQQAFPGCFDRTARTPCDLIAICESSNPSISAHCPLPASQLTGASLCSDDISPEALEALDLGGSSDPAVRAAWEEAVFTDEPDATAQYFAYQDEYRACGFPLSCLKANHLGGLDYDPADDCPVNPGCLDFSVATECPQDGLIDVLASVRGQEGYNDVNGNGVRDADETFIDYPEPFLDKNSSCSYDDLNHLSSRSSVAGVPGRLAPNEVIRLSDQYIETDEANDDRFGFVIDGARRETNGRFDLSTDVFMKTSILHLRGGAGLQFGLPANAASCGADGTTAVTCGPFPGTSTCTENARTSLGGRAILESCAPSVATFREGDSVTFAFRWTDANGNCPVGDFDGAPTVAADKLLELAVDDSDYNAGDCGGLPGAINASNAERPWCEEHPGLGAGVRLMTATVACAGETGPQVAKLTFQLEGTTQVRNIVVGCPVCGDGQKEGDDEECDEGPNGGNGCTPECTLDAT